MSLLSDTETPAPALIKVGGTLEWEGDFPRADASLPLPENGCSHPHGNGGRGKGGGNHISWYVA